MLDVELPCEAADASARTVHAVRPAKLDMFLAELPAAQAVYARAAGFAAKPQELVLLPGQDGIAAAALGLGDDRSPHAFGDLAYRLPRHVADCARGSFR